MSDVFYSQEDKAHYISNIKDLSQFNTTLQFFLFMQSTSMPSITFKKFTFLRLLEIKGYHNVLTLTKATYL